MVYIYYLLQPGGTLMRFTMFTLYNYIPTRSVNARFARRIVGQSNFTCPFEIDQLGDNLKSISFLYRKEDRNKATRSIKTIPTLPAPKRGCRSELYRRGDAHRHVTLSALVERKFYAPPRLRRLAAGAS